MMNKIDVDIDNINKIIKKTIGGMNSSRDQIFNIIDNLRSENEKLILEMVKIRDDINRVINEVDLLEKQDKLMRQKLASVSSNFNKYTERDIKEAYEKASDIRIKFITKTNEEQVLKEKRYSLEVALKKSMENIESAEKIINQISLTIGYLEGDLLSVLNGDDKNSDMYVGIKILEAQENERKRIARDIHDGPAQHMANVIMNIDICKKIIKKDLDEGLKELDDLKENVKAALKDVRSIIFDLRPMSLDDLGLNQTIEETVKTIIGESKVDIKLRLKPIQIEIDPIIQIAVYRIIQEVFNNIKKHSEAKYVEVNLDYGTRYLILIINDDGIGFNVEETLNRVKTKGTSYGFIGILDRVNQLQGEIQIKSSEGVGTVYNVRLPISREVIRDEKRGN